MSNINIRFDTNLKINFNNKDIPQYIPNIFKILNLNPSSQINILFVDNNKIAELNSEFRGILEPTDILSFSPDFSGTYYGTEKNKKINNIDFPKHSDINKILIGDLAISLEYIKNQNENKRIIFDNEIKKLIIHGILHLNGYDHENIKDEKKMTEKQNYILNKIKY
jgi:probable rRNA maturation factor